MSASVKRALVLALGAVLVLLLAVVAARVERGRGDSVPRAWPGGTADGAVVVEAPARSAGERSSPRSAGELAAAPAGAAEDELGGPAPDRHARRLPVTGRVVDENGAGIAGAEVSFARGRAAPGLVARSGHDGTFAGALDHVRTWMEFLVHAEGRTRAEVSVRGGVGDAIHLGTIVLAPGGEVRGLVVDESGAPVARALVLACPAEAFPVDQKTARVAGIEVGERVPDGLTDDQGRFHLRGVGFGPRFVVGVREHLEGGWDWCEPFELLPGSTPEVRIVLPMRDRDEQSRWIAGIVRAPDGSPLEGIHVEAGTPDRDGLDGLGYGGEDLARSDAEGRFVLRGWSRSIVVSACDTKLRYGEIEQAGVMPGMRDVELRFVEPVWVEIRVEDRTGEPVPWGHVRGVGGSEHARLPELDLGRAGRARIPLPRRPLLVEANAPGFRTRRHGPLAPEELGRERELVLVLEPGQALRGRVSFEGRPVAGATLDLCRTGEPGTWNESISVAPLDRPFAITGGVELDASDGTSDARGAFVLTIPDDGWYGLRVEAAGFPTLVRGPFELSTAGHDGFEIELARAGALEGRVLLAAGRAPFRSMVGISDGWGYARTTAAGEDGSFRFEDLAPGRYQVRSCAPPVGARQVLWRDHTARDDAIEWDCAVVAGATTRFDLDLTQESACVLAGSFGLGDEVPREWAAELRDPARDVVRARAVIDRDGRFRLAVSEPGLYRLRVADRTRSFHQEVVLASGELPWELRRETGLLRIVAGEDRERVAGALRFVQEPAGAPRFEARLWLGVDGDEASVSVPTGPGRLELQEKRDAPRRTLGEVEIRSGAETAFRLPDAF